MENKAHAIAAGFFVLLTAALLVALTVWLTRERGAQAMYDVVTREAVTGLQPQASVRYRGVRVGKVAAIGFDAREPGQVLVRIAIETGTPITRSTFASLGFQGITGIAFVQLDDSGESRELLGTGGAEPTRIPMRPGLVSRLAERSGQILDQLEESTRRINALLAPDNQKLLLGSVGALGQAASSLAGGADEMKKAAVQYGRLAHTLQAPGGVLDQWGQSGAALTAAGQAVQGEILPRIQQGAEEAAWAARQVGRTAATLNANPQALLLGPAPGAPGPGEPGFVVPGAKP